MGKVSEAHLEARRRSIIDAASSVFSRKGVDSATMADVAAVAGISPGAIYRYFTNKEDLARGCLEESAHGILDQWLQRPDSSEDPAGELDELARLTFSLLNDPAERSESVLAVERLLTLTRENDESMRREFRSEFKGVISGIESRLRLVQAAGQLSPAVDVHAVAGMLFSLYWGARLVRMVLPDIDTDGQWAAARELLWNSTATPALERLQAGQIPAARSPG